MDELAVRRMFADFESLSAAVVNFESITFIHFLGVVVGQSMQISNETPACRTTHPCENLASACSY